MSKKNKLLFLKKNKNIVIYVIFAIFFVIVTVVALNWTIIKKELCMKFHDNKFECYETYYQTLVQKKDIKDVYIDLRRNFNKDNTVKLSCHQLTHAIGRAAAKKYLNISEAFKHGDSFCFSGYYHGVMEGIASKMDINNFMREINSICSNISGKERHSFDYWNCVHGLGHGIMYVKDDEIFNSLKTCDLLNRSWEQTTCYSGVFMENLVVDTKYHTSKYVKDNDTFYPCNVVEEKYKNVCIVKQTYHMLKINRFDFSKVFELCQQVPDAYIDTCYYGLGLEAATQSTFSIAKTRTLCLLGKDFKQQSNCIRGATSEFIHNFNSANKAKQLCSSLPSYLKSICFDELKISSSNL